MSGVELMTNTREPAPFLTPVQKERGRLGSPPPDNLGGALVSSDARCVGAPCPPHPRTESTIQDSVLPLPLCPGGRAAATPDHLKAQCQVKISRKARGSKLSKL